MSFSHYLVTHPRLRRWITRMLISGDERFIELLGGRFLINPQKEHGYYRAERISRNCNPFRYEAAGIINLAMLLEDGDTFVDIGANVGLFCITLSRIQQLGRRVNFYAYEANPDTLIRLQRSAEALPIVVRGVALSERAGTLTFVPGGVSNAFTTEDNAGEWNILSERQTVDCRRLDGEDLAGDRLILKIDVEGQESQVLAGAEGLFHANRVKAVYLDGFKDKGIPKRLQEWGFSLHDGWSLTPADQAGFCLLAVKR